MRFLIVVVVAFASTCASQKSSPGKPPVDGEEPAPPPATVSPLSEAMQDHWALTTWTRDALIAGDLETAGKGARILATHEPNDAVPDWTPFVSEMEAHAARVADAPTLDEAAAAVGDLAATCGACHVETGAVLRFSDETPPPASSHVDQHMARHAWASRLLWQGLVGPNDESWAAGAEALRDRPLHDNDYFDRWAITPEIERLGVRVHDIGIAATTARSDARAELFGELVATCAECHTALRPN